MEVLLHFFWFWTAALAFSLTVLSQNVAPLRILHVLPPGIATPGSRQIIVWWTQQLLFDGVEITDHANASSLIPKDPES